MDFLERLANWLRPKKKIVGATQPPPSYETIPPAVTIAASNTPSRAKDHIVIPTRQEMLAVYIDMAEGKIPTAIGPWKKVRESQGANRSKAIDELNRRQGTALGSAYCQSGQQESLDELCKYYGVDRKLVQIPEGASTQSVFNDTNSKWKVKNPKAMCWIIWQQGTKWQGHVGMCLSELHSNGKIKTFEFNTSAGTLSRDGSGAHFSERNPAGYASLRLKGYIDIYLAITEAIKLKDIKDQIGA